MSDVLSLETGPEFQPQTRMLLRFIKGAYPIPTEAERQPFAYTGASWWSKLLFAWVNPILRVGYTRTVRPQDLYYFTPDLEIELLTRQFRENLARRVEAARAAHREAAPAAPQDEKGDADGPAAAAAATAAFVWPPRTMLWSMFDTLRHDFYKLVFLAALCFIFMLLLPLVMKQLIRFVELYLAPGLTQRVAPGIGYAVGSCLALMCIGFLFAHYLYFALAMGMKVRAVLVLVVLQKLFVLSPAARRKYTAGKITALMGTDILRVEIGMLFVPLLIVLPIPFIVSVVILIINIGVLALIGIGVFLFFLGVMGAAMATMFKYRAVISKLTERRVDLIKEVVTNLKMIKFYLWEAPYLAKIVRARSEEIGVILGLQAAKNLMFAIALSLTGIAAMVLFLALYKIHGSTKLPAEIFSLVLTFETLSICIFLLPQAMLTCVDVLSAFARTQRLVLCEEEEPDPRYRLDGVRGAIEVEGADFRWDASVIADDAAEVKEARKEAKAKAKERKVVAKKFGEESTEAVAAAAAAEAAAAAAEAAAASASKAAAGSAAASVAAPFLLRNITLSIPRGAFVVVTGVIGLGKLSLLHALAGAMRLDRGHVAVHGHPLMCGELWVQSASIRDNIVFGSAFDERRYRATLHACLLQQDLAMLEAGDRTEVGERGITLLGGQRARINLARAVYAAPDVLLLDDVLSAVDARVGRAIMANCIMGQLRGTTRVLATHQLLLIHSADQVVFLNGDGTIDVGSVESLQRSNEAFRNLMSFSSAPAGDDDDADEAAGEDGGDQETFSEKPEKTLPEATAGEKASLTALSSAASFGKLAEAEEKAVNRISFSVYLQMIKVGAGRLGVPGFLLLFPLAAALATFSSLFTNTWLLFWIEYKFRGKHEGFYMGIYAMLTFATVLFIAVEFFVLVTVTTRLLERLNLAAVRRLLHAPMSFIDTTPLGRILNRFTKDTDALDNEINDNLRQFFYGFANLIGILILCCVYLPWILIAIPFFFGVFLLLADYTQATTREVKRIEAVQRLHVYNNYAETLGGMATIKNYGLEARFLATNYRAINTMNEATLIVNGTQRWLLINLEFAVFFFALLITLLCVNGVFNISAASTGLVVSYAFSIGNELLQCVRIYTMVENDMNSAERIQSYALHMQQEAPFENPATKPALLWPLHGAIEFDHVGMSYRPGLPLVLKDLTFTVAPGEKIGICGRTGAGKSSIMTALFRISELQHGCIRIDGVDISTLGLFDLRSKLLIIPQDPVLFNGTIRKNLDPFEERCDEDIWHALTRAGVIDAGDLALVRAGAEHKFHLDQKVEAQGANYLLGERQLISFARALLRNTKVLILDEATSSVDYETDAKIQKTIVREFSDCTILCIAHRLKTIINYDKIMTLEQGSLAEFGAPWSLYESHGLFRQICDKASIVASDFERR